MATKEGLKVFSDASENPTAITSTLNIEMEEWFRKNSVRMVDKKIETRIGKDRNGDEIYFVTILVHYESLA